MKTKILLSLLLIAGCQFFVGCSNSTQSDEAASTESDPAVPAIEPGYSAYGSLIWENERPTSQSWSHYLFQVLDQEAPDLINGSQDMGSFCPNYRRLLRSEKILFWGHLISQIAKFESGFSPVSRFREPSRKDAITGQALYSEGLLQLSYQDLQFMPRCEFDWQRDRTLAATDSRKTILNPYRNLRCGVLILNRQLHRSDRIVLSSGAYWAVIKSDSAYSKLNLIQKFTKSLAICQPQ